VLEERLRLMRGEKYGAGGEKLSLAQMQLFELAPVVSEMIEQAESEPAPVHRPTKRSTKHPGRQELPCESSAHRADSAWHTGSAPLQTLVPNIQITACLLRERIIRTLVMRNEYMLNVTWRILVAENHQSWLR
jgi:hypothetical protein